jgi:hypothetical protein
MKRTSFDVLMRTPSEDNLEATTEHRVTLVLGDQLRGELEGKKFGLSVEAHPTHTASLWVWAAVHRLGLYDGTFNDFKSDCVDFEKVKDDVDVDPTQLAALSGSA